jgi:hypothetical protein
MTRKQIVALVAVSVTLDVAIMTVAIIMLRQAGIL